MIRPQRARIIFGHDPLGEPPGGGEVGGEHGLEVVLGHADEQAVAGDAGVGHEHLDGAELLLDRG